MGDGGEHVRDLDSSAQAEEDMAVESKYVLKMVVLGDQKNLREVQRLLPRPPSMVRSSSEEFRAKILVSGLYSKAHATAPARSLDPDPR